MKLPSSTMGFARVSFPLIQAGGVWQCRYSCILWAPKLWPPIWIQAFQIVKWHSSFFSLKSALWPEFSSVLGFFSSLISLFSDLLIPLPTWNFCVYSHSPPFLIHPLIASFSPTLISLVFWNEGLQWPTPPLQPCPHALTPTPSSFG